MTPNQTHFELAARCGPATSEASPLLAELGGFVLVNKPRGITSFDALSKARKQLGIRKAGHAGTLDPFATGLLVCALGRATRLIPFVQGGQKGYSGVVRLGLSTTSDDITGVELARVQVPSSMTLKVLDDEAEAFRGQFLQQPPAVSAKKVEGRRAYDLARAGVPLQLSASQVRVDELSLSNLEFLADGTARVAFRILCGKGTYIRSIARDLGAKLGIGGCLETLHRFLSAPFAVTEATVPEALTTGSIRPWFEALSLAGMVKVSTEEAKRIKNGCERTVRKIGEQGLIQRSCESRNGADLALLSDQNLIGCVPAGESNPEALLALDHVTGVWRVAAHFWTC